MYNITIHFILTAMSFLDIKKEGMPDCHLIQFFFTNGYQSRRTQLWMCIHQIGHALGFNKIITFIDWLG